MATYEYKCRNENCKEYDIAKTIDIPIKEYNEDKLPICERCGEKTKRVFSFGGAQNFDGKYRG